MIEYKLTAHIYPNLEILEKRRDGEFTGYIIKADKGYKFYDKAANDKTIDSETGEEVPTINYTKERFVQKSNLNFQNFSFVALKDSGEQKCNI